MNPDRAWRDPLVKRLVRGHPGKTPEQVIEKYAEDRLREAGQTRLPVDVEGIASLLGIRRRLGDHPFAGRVYVEPSGQLVMDLNASDPEPRRRFTCGHEIMHTAFPGFRRETRYRSDAAVGGFNGSRGEEELLCDLGAAALLMPASLVRGRYSAAGGLRDMEALASAAETSLEAAANRLVALADGPVVFVVLESGHKPADGPALKRGETVQKRLRVRYAVTSGIRTHVPRFKSADNDSVLARALDTSEIERGVEALPGDAGGRPFDVQARAYSRHGDDGEIARVLAFACPSGGRPSRMTPMYSLLHDRTQTQNDRRFGPPRLVGR